MSKVRVPMALLSGEGQLPRQLSLHCKLTGRKGDRALRGPFIRAQSHSWGLHPHNLITSQRPRLLTPSAHGVGFCTCILGRHKHSDHSDGCITQHGASKDTGSDWTVTKTQHKASARPGTYRVRCPSRLVPAGRRQLFSF